jgi:hypothetical protein
MAKKLYEYAFTYNIRRPEDHGTSTYRFHLHAKNLRDAVSMAKKEVKTIQYAIGLSGTYTTFGTIIGAGTWRQIPSKYITEKNKAEWGWVSIKNG